MRFIYPILLACFAVLPPMAYPACPHPAVDTSQWHAIDVGPFHIKTPRDYQKDQTQGYDSLVGRWKAPGEWVLYDFGPHTAPPETLDRYLEVQACDEQIGGRQARVITYRKPDNSYVVAAHWADTGQEDKRLGLMGEATKPAGRDRLLAVVRSVVFEP